MTNRKILFFLELAGLRKAQWLSGRQIVNCRIPNPFSISSMAFNKKRQAICPFFASCQMKYTLTEGITMLRFYSSMASSIAAALFFLASTVMTSTASADLITVKYSGTGLTVLTGLDSDNFSGGSYELTMTYDTTQTYAAMFGSFPVVQPLSTSLVLSGTGQDGTYTPNDPVGYWASYGVNYYTAGGAGLYWTHSNSSLQLTLGKFAESVPAGSAPSPGDNVSLSDFNTANNSTATDASIVHNPGPNYTTLRFTNQSITTALTTSSVPEPSSFALIGLLAVGAVYRRRRNG